MAKEGLKAHQQRWQKTSIYNYMHVMFYKQSVPLYSYF